MEIADEALRAVVDAGTLDPLDYARMTIPTWNRSTAEFLAPFESGALDGELELRRHAACEWHVVLLDIARIDAGDHA
jgi:hypothetical protein